MSDEKSSTQPHYSNPSLVYNEAWLVKYTVIGGILLALGSYYLPSINDQTTWRWFWNILAGQYGNGLDIIGLALVLFPLLMLKVLPRNVLAISLLAFASFMIITILLPDLTRAIKYLAQSIIPAPPTAWSSHLVIYSILAIFLLSTLCKALQEQLYPIILLRVASAFLLILLFLQFVTPPFKYHLNLPDYIGFLNAIHVKLFLFTAVAYALSGLSQSFRKAPAAVVKILFFVLLLISLIGGYFFSALLVADTGVAALLTMIYILLRGLILIGGILILLRCSIIMSCIQYTGRRI